jgi:regulation of enolase protein 1 (concanavalin A-like superfamily)
MLLTACLLAACDDGGSVRQSVAPPTIADLSTRPPPTPTNPPPTPAYAALPTLPPLPTLAPTPTGTQTPLPRAERMENFGAALRAGWGMWDPRQLAQLAVDPRRHRLVIQARAATSLSDEEAPSLLQWAQGEFIAETRVVDQVCVTAGLIARDTTGSYAVLAYQRDQGHALLTGIREQKRRFFLDYPYVGQGLALRMIRIGDTVRGEISTDRQIWRGIGQGTLPLDDTVLVGLVLWPTCDEAHVAFDYFRLAQP